MNRTNHYTNKHQPQLRKLHQLLETMVENPILAEQLNLNKKLSYDELVEHYENWLDYFLDDNLAIESHLQQPYFFKLHNFLFDVSDEKIPVYFIDYDPHLPKETIWISISEDLEKYLDYIDDPNCNLKEHFDAYHEDVLTMKQKPERKKISLEAYSKKLKAKAKEKVIKDGNDALRHLESYADGIPLKVIKNFVYANFKSFVLQNIEAIDFNKGFTINIEDKSFKGDFGISLHNANELNKFSEVYSRLSYLLLFLEKTNHYKKQLELVKDVDTGDYTNYQFLKTWWEENFPDAFDINQRLFWIEYEDQTTYKLTDLVPGFYTPSKHLPNIKIKKQDIAQLFDFIATVDNIETALEKMS